MGSLRRCVLGLSLDNNLISGGTTFEGRIPLAFTLFD